MTDHQTVELDGITLSYQVSGDPQRPPLLLLHALGESASDWDEVLPALTEHHRVYALDLRGHGKSSRSTAYSLELMRDDVHDFLNALDLKRVALVGHSLGGIVAYLFAAVHPDQVTRLVLEDAPAPLPRKPLPLTRPDGPLSFDWDMVLAVRPQLDDPDPAWLLTLGEITAPTLVVAGGPRSHVPEENIAELVRRIPDCRSVTVPVGHLVHANAPDAFIVAVTGFLRG
jgi:pimeloyl-ACP methyl ester carboxylesterase